MINLTVKQIQHLKALAHNLNPVVMIGGNGLTDGVIKEININLDAHELIKIKTSGIDSDVRDAVSKEICNQTNSHFVQQIGKLIIIYRASKKQKILLPK